MVNETLTTNYTLYRPNKQTGKPTIAVTYSKYYLFNVKVGQPSEGWQISTDGATTAMSGTLFYHEGKSFFSPIPSPLFKEGDIIAEFDVAENPPVKRYVVKSIIKQTYKGKLHHLEVILG